MARNLLFLFHVLVIVQVATADLITDASGLLEDLKSLAEVQISEAGRDLGQIYDDFLEYGRTTRKEAADSLDETFSEFTEKSEQLTGLAEDSGKDISVCVDPRLDWMADYLKRYKGDTETCLLFQNAQLRNILDNALYVVDTIITKVHALEFQLDKCNGEESCISKLIKDIGVENTKLPASIEEEVKSFKDFVEMFLPSISTCTDVPVIQYSSEGKDHLKEMEICINFIIEHGVLISF